MPASTAHHCLPRAQHRAWLATGVWQILLDEWQRPTPMWGAGHTVSTTLLSCAHRASSDSFNPHLRGRHCRHRESGQRLIEFWQENALVTATPSSNNTREDSTHGHHQMVNTEIRLIIFFAAKDGEALYSQQEQDQELTVAQTMSSLLPNSDWNWRK